MIPFNGRKKHERRRGENGRTKEICTILPARRKNKKTEEKRKESLSGLFPESLNQCCRANRKVTNEIRQNESSIPICAGVRCTAVYSRKKASKISKHGNEEN